LRTVNFVLAIIAPNVLLLSLYWLLLFLLK